jgi:FkbM family methyltransferase
MIADIVASALRPLPHFKGRGRLTGWLTPATGSGHARIYGSDMDLDRSDLIQRAVYLGNYERWESKQVRRYLRSGQTFVDVGANIGYFTALSSKLVGPNGRVVAFEPSEKPYGALIRVFGRCPNVECLNIALSNSESQLTIYVPPQSCGNHDPSVHRYCSGMEEVRVPARRLDSLAEELGIEKIDFLKIDVEGHELSVLAGAESLLRARAIRRILCEFNPALLAMGGHKPADLLAVLEHWGFHRESAFHENRLCNVLLALG